MWIDYFHYRYCMANDTLFIEGAAEGDLVHTAYAMPIGAMPTSDALNLLRHYCRTHGHRLRLSAVPEDCLINIHEVDPQALITPIPDWNDYIYSAESLTSLSGNALKRKRNHVNRFLADNPTAEIQCITPSDIPTILSFLNNIAPEQHQSELALEEWHQTLNILKNWSTFSNTFYGAVLRTSVGGRIAAIAVGEVIGDMLFVHIEKSDHNIAGAGESINNLFAKQMCSLLPQIRYINREEDVGDLGIREAKLSYRPSIILKKFNVTFA
jgi:hypothetical protein